LRRTFFLALLFAACAFSAACVDTNKPGTPGASPTPTIAIVTPTPTTVVDNVAENGERPIIINGGAAELKSDGSVEIDFNHKPGYWSKDLGQKYICYGCRITEYWMYKAGQTFEPKKDFVKYIGSITRLSIKAKNKDGVSKNIDVNQVASNVELLFDSNGTYTSVSTDERKHRSQGIEVQQVKVNSEADECRDEDNKKADCAKFANEAYRIRIKVERSSLTVQPAEKK